MEGRINVILDLDNTIINALEEDELVNVPLNFQNKFIYHDMNPYFRIFGRPHLEQFLDFLFENFNVSVFTAAEHKYAMFIIENFIYTKPSRQLDFILFRNHVDMTKKLYGKDKDLRLLFDIIKPFNFYKCNTVIIDDLDEVCKANPNNCIPVIAFNVATRNDNKDSEDYYIPNYNSADDNELLRVMNKLKIIKNKFDLSGCTGCIYRQQPPKGSILEIFI